MFEALNGARCTPYNYAKAGSTPPAQNTPPVGCALRTKLPTQRTPHAAARDSIRIEAEQLAPPSEPERLLIELAGGLMVPLRSDYLNIDLIAAPTWLELPHLASITPEVVADYATRVQQH